MKPIHYEKCYEKNGDRKSTLSVNALLLSQGYSERTIKELHKDKRIVLVPRRLTSKISADAELYILEVESVRPSGFSPGRFSDVVEKDDE